MRAAVRRGDGPVGASKRAPKIGEPAARWTPKVPGAVSAVEAFYFDVRSVFTAGCRVRG